MADLNRWKKCLDHLLCPYTKDFSVEEVGDLLLNESKERLEILEWLLLLYQPRLTKVLEPQDQKKELGQTKKSKTERILTAFNTIGLCHAEDIDLIKGAAPLNRQRHFINRLMDLVMAKDSDQIICPGDLCAYIDSLADRGMFLKIDDQFDLLPKDIRAEVVNISPRINPQSLLEELRVTYQQCVEGVERLQQELAVLQRKISIPSSTQQKEVLALNQMLSSSIQDLDQLSAGFVHSYESHIGTWCQQSSPELSDLGTCAKRVHDPLKKFISFLEDSKKLRQLRCALEDKIRDNHVRHLVETAVPTDDSVLLQKMQPSLINLEESMHRVESGFKSCYPNLLHLLKSDSSL